MMSFLGRFSNGQKCPFWDRGLATCGTKRTKMSISETSQKGQKERSYDIKRTKDTNMDR